MTTKLKLVLGGAIGFFVLMIAMGGKGGSSSPETSSSSAPAPATEPAIPISATDLWRRYDDNEAAADDAFKGRKLQVTGVIDSIDKDMFGHVIVMLRSPNQFASVHARLDKASARAASSLKKRSTITVSCTGAGKVIASPMLDDCWF